MQTQSTPGKSAFKLNTTICVSCSIHVIYMDVHLKLAPALRKRKRNERSLTRMRKRYWIVLALTTT